MVDKPLTSRGAATRDRIIEIATREFAQHGIAGARIERIVADARTNKAQLYGYFGNKEALFDAIFNASLDRIVDAVPIGDDLADWAVRLYDDYLRRPDLVRLATWSRLERRPTGDLLPDADHRHDHKLRAIAEGQDAGRIRPGDPFDVMTLVISMSMAWSPVSNVFAAHADEPEEAHERRRRLLRDSVHRAVMVAS
ncbi:TetR family transcriptional regulator [Saccharopolyspora sp. TS4A08]|uniref:TetR family transcriptional regulator n=1 Tax=Saccharopolyspora ipomoeae TaxID=3042027 RepID=A0ABT6PQ07_9PSEU|nr:TetR family transcriptional regulator [Saccharopolyspora sp. TS4A08]MDI2029977.1 TetR family transcriptional regulator [Saccharopolyspora sp. TS4A08]